MLLSALPCCGSFLSCSCAVMLFCHTPVRYEPAVGSFCLVCLLAQHFPRSSVCSVSGAGDLTNVVVAEYLQRIADLEHRLLLAKEEVSTQQALAGRGLETIDQCQRTVAECQPALQRHQKEVELMSADMAVLQQCLAQRNADVFDLRRQVSGA